MIKITKKQLINLIKEEISEIQSTSTKEGGFVDAVKMLVNSGVPEKLAVEVVDQLRDWQGRQPLPPQEPVTLRKLGDERNLEESNDFDDLRRGPEEEEKRSVEAILDNLSAGVRPDETEIEMLVRYLEMTSSESTSHGAVEDVVASMPPVEDVVASMPPVDPFGDTAEQPSRERPEGTYKEFPPLERPGPPGKNKDTMGGALFPGKARGMNRKGLSEAIRREIRNFLKSRA